MGACKNRRSLVVGPKIWAKLKSLAASEERSISDVVREAIIKLLQQREAGIPSGPEYDPVTDSYGRHKENQE